MHFQFFLLANRRLELITMSGFRLPRRGVRAMFAASGLQSKDDLSAAHAAARSGKTRARHCNGVGRLARRNWSDDCSYCVRPHKHRCTAQVPVQYASSPAFGWSTKSAMLQASTASCVKRTPTLLRLQFNQTTRTRFKLIKQGDYSASVVGLPKSPMVRRGRRRLAQHVTANQRQPTLDTGK